MGKTLGKFPLNIAFWMEGGLSLHAMRCEFSDDGYRLGMYAGYDMHPF